MKGLRVLTISRRLPALFGAAAGLGALAAAAYARRPTPPTELGLIALALATAMLLGWLTARSIAHPLTELRAKLEKLAAGEWDQVLKDRSADEIGALSEALNAYVLMRDNEPLTRQDAVAAAAELGPAPRDRELAGLRTLLSLSRELQTAFDFTEAAGKLLLAVNGHLRLEWSSVALLDAGKQSLTLAASSGFSETLSHELALEGGIPIRYSAREGISGEVVASGEPLAVNKGERDPRFKSFPAPRAGTLPGTQPDKPRTIRTMACLPLKVGGEVAGIGNFVNISSAEGFGGAEMAFLEEVMALSARLYLKVRAPAEAFREAVSGLHEHEYWKGLFTLECQRYRRRPSRISLVKVRCAFARPFVPVPEQNGLLSSIGSLIRESIRGQDGATRKSDSFYVFLPETDTLGALFFAGRLKDRIDSLGGRADDPEQRFRAAVGVACCPEHVPEPEALVGAVDSAVRESFRIGDHRLVCFQREADVRAAEPGREEAS